MTTEKLFDDGKYMVIYLYPESVKFDERMFFLWTKQDHEQVVNLYDFISFKNIFKIISKYFFCLQVKQRGNSCQDMIAYQDKLLAWKSLIIVSGSPYRIDTTEFADTVRKYNSLPPFQFPVVNFPIMSPKLVSKPDISIHITIYAAHLYDSVILYAKALDKIIREDPKARVSELARDGERITRTIIAMGGYQVRVPSEGS